MNECHVCIVSSVHPPFDVRIFHKEARSLIKGGYNVTFLVPHERDEIKSGVKISHLQRHKKRLIRMIVIPVRIFFYIIIMRPRIVHFHDPELLPACVITKFFLNCKIIYDVHENVCAQILNKDWIKLSLRKIIAKIYHITERIFIPFVDYIILAEESYESIYKQYGINYKVIRNYPILSYFCSDGKESNNFHDDSEKFYLIYVGGITVERGVFELIKSIKIIKDNGIKKIVLILVGPMYPLELEKEVRKTLEEYDLVENVLLYGVEDYSKIEKLLSKSMVGLCVLHPIPNYIDSLPTKLFEYMAAGLPVIASDFPAWRKIVDKVKCGLLVDPLNPKEIADAINYLINHPEKAEIMGNHGREAVNNIYNWEKEEKALLQLYNELAKSYIDT